MLKLSRLVQTGRLEILSCEALAIRPPYATLTADHVRLLPTGLLFSMANRGPTAPSNLPNWHVEPGALTALTRVEFRNYTNLGEWHG